MRNVSLVLLFQEARHYPLYLGTAPWFCFWNRVLYVQRKHVLADPLCEAAEVRVIQDFLVGLLSHSNDRSISFCVERLHTAVTELNLQKS